MKYKVGDTVIIISSPYHGTYWQNGEECIIIRVDEGDIYKVKSNSTNAMIRFRGYMFKIIHNDPIIKSMLEVIK